MYRVEHRVDKKIKYGKLRLYILIFFLLSAIIFIILFKTDYFNISGILVNNNKAVTNEEIISYSGIQIGENIFKIKLSEARNKIIKSPLIKDATIKRKLPNKLLIEVKERKKLAAVLYMGIYFIIDDEGVVLYTSHDIDNVCTIEGFEFESFIEGENIKVENQEVLKKTINLCGFLEKSNLNFQSKIVYNNENIVLYINQNFRVEFGKAENLEKRFAIFTAIYEDLTSKNVDSGIIDISHDGYPTYSPFEE